MKVCTTRTVTRQEYNYARQLFIEGLSTGIMVPSGKGKRLIIVHIGSEERFLTEGLLTFKSCHTGDYHKNMNSDVYEDYFREMITQAIIQDA